MPFSQESDPEMNDELGDEEPRFDDSAMYTGNVGDSVFLQE
jgi:hypothetical protein